MCLTFMLGYSILKCLQVILPIDANTLPVMTAYCWWSKSATSLTETSFSSDVMSARTNQIQFLESKIQLWNFAVLL